MGNRYGSKKSTMILVPLHSAGCFVDILTNITYPMMGNGKPDLCYHASLHVDDCCSEWVEDLEDGEKMTIGIY